MKHHKITPTRRGFTLIELLVVITIIAVLSAVGFGAYTSVLKKGQKLDAKNDCSNVVLAVESYYDEYLRLPAVRNRDTKTETDTELMSILLGFDNTENPKGRRFFNGGKEAKGNSSATAFNGLYYSTDSATPLVELFDPYPRDGKPKGRHYEVLLDGDYDDEIRDPTSTSANKILRGKRVLVWTAGKDNSLSQEKDNVYSWKSK